EHDHVLLLTIHHIVFDGWSMSVLLRELSVLYNAFTAGAANPLPPLPIQYADYTIWQREWLQGPVLEQQIGYWKERLSNPPPPVLQLPTDFPRGTTTSRGGSLPIRLPRRLTDDVIALGRQERVTLFMTLLAAFQTLLHRYTGQGDIAVGSAMAGRNQ